MEDEKRLTPTRMRDADNDYAEIQRYPNMRRVWARSLLAGMPAGQKLENTLRGTYLEDRVRIQNYYTRGDMANDTVGDEEADDVDELNQRLANTIENMSAKERPQAEPAKVGYPARSGGEEERNVHLGHEYPDGKLREDSTAGHPMFNRADIAEAHHNAHEIEQQYIINMATLYIKTKKLEKKIYTTTQIANSPATTAVRRAIAVANGIRYSREYNITVDKYTKALKLANDNFEDLNKYAAFGKSRLSHITRPLPSLSLNQIYALKEEIGKEIAELEAEAIPFKVQIQVLTARLNAYTRAVLTPAMRVDKRNTDLRRTAFLISDIVADYTISQYKIMLQYYDMELNLRLHGNASPSSRNYAGGGRSRWGHHDTNIEKRFFDNNKNPLHDDHQKHGYYHDRNTAATAIKKDELKKFQ
jgi:hypothetical protein